MLYKAAIKTLYLHRDILNYIPMKMKSILFTFLLLITSVLVAQNYVSTEPQDKNAILEEFTGVSCPNCPAGHVVMAGILAANPYRAFCIAYHPSNSSFTTPYPGDPDFRRTYPNVFYTTPYCGSGRFMPSSFINRRIYGGDRLQSRAQWAGYANGIMAEPSPANMGLSTTFDFMTQMLNITVEIYYTDNMTDDNTVYVLLAENDLVSQQSGASGPYTHKHTFREAFVGQWGDLITEPTTQGSLVTLEYSWDATGSGYIMSNCEVLAFIENQASGEIITGVGVHVGESTYIEPTADFTVEDNTVGVGYGAIFTDESAGNPTEWEWTFDGGDPATSSLQEPPPITYDTPGLYTVELTVTNPAGSNTMTMTDFISVGFPPVVGFTLLSSPNILVGDSLIFEDASLYIPTSWTWIFEGGDPDTVYQQNPPPIYYYETGQYDVTLVVENDYGLDLSYNPDMIDVGNIGLNEHNGTSAFSIYPNPSTGIINIELTNELEIEEVLVRSISGQEVLVFAPKSGLVQTLDLTDLEKGLYFVEIRTEGRSLVEKVVLK